MRNRTMTSRTAPLRIGNQLQLFVDDYLIEASDGVELKLQTPQPAGKAIAFDKPWEGNVSAYVSVFHDGDKYRMYYRGASAPSYARKIRVETGRDTLSGASELHVLRGKPRRHHLDQAVARNLRFSGVAR